MPRFGERVIQATSTKIVSIILKNSGPFSHIRTCTSIIETDVYKYMLFRDIVAICSEKNVEQVNAICGQNNQDGA